MKEDEKMKKITSLLLVIVLAISLVAITGCQDPHEHSFVDGKCNCGATDPNYVPPHEHSFVDGKCECGATDPNYVPPHEHNFVDGKCECGATDPDYVPDKGINDKSEGVMTWEEYDAAELDAEVVVEAYVQGHQSWWNNKVTVYLQDLDGGYFAYEMTCTEEDAAKLVPGTKIRITGYKAAWSGEVEIVDCTFEFCNDGLTYVAEPVDVTSLLGTDGLIRYQNMLVEFKGMTVSSIEYKNGEPGDDIYVNLTKDGAEYSFCVERYLTGPETELYTAVGELKAGDVIDVEGFLYWYNGVNTHMTSIKKAGFSDTKSEGVMTWEEYDAAELDAEVVVEAYVQGHQSWWNNKVTVYLQDLDGGYFAYEMTCTEEDAAKLVPGTKIRITGYKAAWSGEVEIVDCTFEFCNDGLTYVAEPVDVTSLLGTDGLIRYQNMLVEFKGMTVSSIEYKNGEPGDDIYVNLTKDGAEYSFCVERYLTGPETELYTAVGELKAGDVIDVEGFLYWYNGVNTHITSIK